MHLDLAYIDPGSGSLIIQAVIATIVAIPFFFRHQIARVADRFRGHQDDQGTIHTPDGPDHDG